MIFFKRKANYILAWLLILVIADRLNILIRFAFKFTDSDQTLLWQASKDLLNGEFHGLCFYGQKYNPLIEPFLALPLIASGIKPWFALPIITTVLSTIPYLLVSYFFYKNNDNIIAALPILVVLLLPPEFLMLTSMPRGFVTGIFFGIIGVLLFLYKSSKTSNILSGIFFGLGFFASPNYVLLSLVLILALKNIEKPVFAKLLQTTVGISLGLVPMFYNSLYYAEHPEMVIHGSPSIKLSWDTFASAFKRLDIFFDHVSPIFWRGGWISLFFFIPVIVRLWKKKSFHEFYAALVLFCAIILSLAVEKVNDASNSVYFSGARMFLAYPLILIFIAKWYYESLTEKGKYNLLIALLFLSVAAFTTRILHLDFYLKEDLKGSKNSVVKVINIDSLQTRCEEMLAFTDKNSNLVLGQTGNGPEQLITYGCPCMIEDFPATSQPYERRTWLLPEILNTNYSNIVVHSGDSVAYITLLQHQPEVGRIHGKYDWILLKNHQHKNTGDFAKELNINLLPVVMQ